MRTSTILLALQAASSTHAIAIVWFWRTNCNALNGIKAVCNGSGSNNLKPDSCCKIPNDDSTQHNPIAESVAIINVPKDWGHVEMTGYSGSSCERPYGMHWERTNGREYMCFPGTGENHGQGNSVRYPYASASYRFLPLKRTDEVDNWKCKRTVYPDTLTLEDGVDYNVTDVDAATFHALIKMRTSDNVPKHLHSRRMN